MGQFTSEIRAIEAVRGLMKLKQTQGENFTDLVERTSMLPAFAYPDEPMRDSWVLLVQLADVFMDALLDEGICVGLLVELANHYTTRGALPPPRHMAWFVGPVAVRVRYQEIVRPGGVVIPKDSLGDQRRPQTGTTTRTQELPSE